MLTTKIRTSIVTAVAALSVLSLGPMTSVASAQPKEGNARLCASLKRSYDFYWEEAEKALHEGKEADANIFIELARETYVEAAIAKCKWASASQTPSPQPKTTREAVPGPLPIKKEEAPAPIKVEKPSTNQGGPSAPPLANG